MEIFPPLPYWAILNLINDLHGELGSAYYA